MASSDLGAQKPIRARGSRKCPNHIGKEVVYVCENCSELACISCVSTVHKGHDLEELVNIIPHRKTKLQDFIIKSEKHEIPKIEEKIRNANSVTSQKKQYYQQQIGQVEKQNETLKDALDKATRKIVKLYRDAEKQDLDILHTHETGLHAQVNDRGSRVQECKDTLQSGDDVQVYDVSNDLPPEFKAIPTPAFPVLSFTPGKFTLQKLEDLIGEVSKRAGRDITPSYQATKYSVVSHFTPYDEHRVKSLHPVPGDKAWVCFAANNDYRPINNISLIDHNGVEQQTLDLRVGVTDFCLSPGSGIPWVCNSSLGIVRQSRGGGGGSVVRFKTDMPPQSICLTADDNVLIGHIGQVVKYTQAGEIIHSSLKSNDAQVIYPFHITQSPKIGNFAVVDLDRKENGGSNRPVVWILDDQLNALSKYCGDTPGGRPLTQPFSPRRACYTTNGSLVITDFHNKSILLVNEHGEYQQTLHTDRNSKPIGICANNDEALWVSYLDGSVHVMKTE